MRCIKYLKPREAIDIQFDPLSRFYLRDVVCRSRKRLLSDIPIPTYDVL